MALKVLMRKKELTEKQKQLVELRKVSETFPTREINLEKAIEEAETEEEKKVVEEEVEKYEADKAENEAAIAETETEIAGIEAEIAEIERSAPVGTPAEQPKNTEEKRGNIMPMNTRRFFGMTPETRDAFLAREDVRDFIEAIREIKTRGITNGSLSVPEVMLELLRDNMEQYSKLTKYVTLKPIGGTARENIMGAAPEGVWMEAEGELNELDMSLNQVEVDGYMVGGIIWIHNNLLKDSDLALGSEIMDQLGKAIGKGIDRALLYGTGTKMPVGIVTRLAQTAAPSNWPTFAPAWTDLHTTNVKKLNINGTTGAAFYASLIEALGVAAPNYSDGKAFWVMNRKTHINLMTKALAFDAAAALIAGVNNQMPIIGGSIEEIELVGDNEIIGGFGSVYILAEREGSALEKSEHARFAQNQTGFKGYARYDGMPVFGEAFVMVSFDNTDAATTSTFETDYANTELGALAVTSVAGTASGDTLVTVAGAEASGTTLGYKVLGKAAAVKSGDPSTGYTAFTTPDDITAATGKIITVVEFDAAGRAIKVGTCSVVAKA
ncbi:phage major capsid protein [Acetobacterium wieringae]|nr:phage major capsid protein [Acetobacterium wieringae]